jgi:lipopolysaccharide export system permease protein
VRIISRYVLREHAGPLVFSLTALTSLLLLNYIAKQFGNLVGKGLPWSVIGEFFALSVPFTVAMTLPMAVLVSTLYAFSRLAAENEITALKASGVGFGRTLVPVMVASSIIALVMLGFNDQVLPRANQRLATLQTDIARTKPSFALDEQVINEVIPGRIFLRANHIDEATSDLREVTIYDLSDQQRRRTIYADSGTMALTPDYRDLQLRLFDGYMMEIPRADPAQLQRLYFEQDLIRVKGVGNTFQQSEGDGFKSDREMSICEMQETAERAWREGNDVRAGLQRQLVRVVHEAAAGEPLDSAALPPLEPPTSLGSAYCAALAAVAGAPDTTRLPGGTSDGSDAAETPAVAAAVPAGLDTAGADSAGADSVRADRAASAGSETARRDTTRTADTAKANAAARRRAESRARAAAQRQDSADFAAAQRLRARPANVRSGTGLIPPSAGIPSSGMTSGAGAYAAMGAFDATRPIDEISGTLDLAVARLGEAERTMNAYEVEIQKKFALAFACIIFGLLGAPIALRFPRGGVGLVISVSLGVFALYYVGLIAGESLGDRGVVPPALAMWAANIILGAVALLLLARIGKEGATARGGDAGELLETLRVWVAKYARRLGIPMERRRRRA